MIFSARTSPSPASLVTSCSLRSSFQRRSAASNVSSSMFTLVDHTDLAICPVHAYTIYRSRTTSMDVPVPHPKDNTHSIVPLLRNSKRPSEPVVSTTIRVYMNTISRLFVPNGVDPPSFAHWVPPWQRWQESPSLTSWVTKTTKEVLRPLSEQTSHVCVINLHWLHSRN